MNRSQKSISVQGDALKVLRQLPNNSMDACLVDPPYNMSKSKGLSWAFSKHVTMQEAWDQFSDEEYFQFSLSWVREVSRVVKPNGNLLFFGTFHNIYTLGFLLQQLNLKVLNSIIWSKPNAQPNITCRMLTESTEQIVWACNEDIKRAKKWTFHYKKAKQMNEGKQMRNIWSFPVTARSERVGNHPSQKPLALMERLVLLFTKKNQVILDPFAGTGTTGLAALQHGRRAFLIEKDPNYIEVQTSRFRSAKLQSKIQFRKRFSGISQGNRLNQSARAQTERTPAEA